MDRNSVPRLPTTSQPPTSGTRMSWIQTVMGAPTVSIPHAMDRRIHPPAVRPADPYYTGRVPQFGGPSPVLRPSFNHGVAQSVPVYGAEQAAQPYPSAYSTEQAALHRPSVYSTEQAAQPYPSRYSTEQAALSYPSRQSLATPISGRGTSLQGIQNHRSRLCPYKGCKCFAYPYPCHPRTPRP